MNKCGQCGEPLAPDHACSGWLPHPTFSKKSIEMSPAGIPKGRLVLRIDGEYYQSYYRTKNKLFVRPINHE